MSGARPAGVSDAGNRAGPRSLPGVGCLGLPWLYSSRSPGSLSTPTPLFAFPSSDPRPTGGADQPTLPNPRPFFCSLPRRFRGSSSILGACSTAGAFATHVPPPPRTQGVGTERELLGEKGRVRD